MRNSFGNIAIRSNPNWEKFMTVNPKALKETQRSIPAGVMLVQYAPVGEQLYIFLVSKESLKIVIAPGKPEELWKKIKTPSWPLIIWRGFMLFMARGIWMKRYGSLRVWCKRIQT